MELACCQFDIAWENKAENYRRVEAELAAAALPAGSLVLLPEMFATGFSMAAECIAEPEDGPTVAFLARTARRHGIWVLAGLVLGDLALGRPRNEALLVDPAGNVAGRYAKRRLFPLAGEAEHYLAGEKAALFAAGGAATAPAICYDLRFPELFREAVGRGAQVLAVIACWPAARQEHWLALLKARAIENQCYLAAVNRIGADPSGQRYCGGSQIIDPWGSVVADAGEATAVIRYRADLEKQALYRRQFPALAPLIAPSGSPH